MAILPPFLIVFDTSAPLAGEPRLWQEFSRLGTCFIPEAVLEALRTLCDRAAEPAIESKAREFIRFFETSGWQTTREIAEHPSLQPAAGHALSQRSRLALEVLQNSFGLAHQRPDGLVILVANDQPMLQRLLGLNQPNLCGLPLSALVQWSRTQRRPAAVNQHLQLMRSTTPVVSAAAPATATPKAPVPAPSSTTRQTAAREISVQQRAASPPPATMPVRSPTSRTKSAVASSPPRPTRRSFRLSSFVANLISLVVLAIVVGGTWRFIHPTSFNQFWQQIPLTKKPGI